MSIIKTATLLPLHTFITIILSYSVVVFWFSSSLLLSSVQSSNCPFTGSLQCWSTSCLNLSSASTIKFRDMLKNIDKEIKCDSPKNAKLKWAKIQNFRKIAKLRCREICEPQKREINVWRKFHVIRWFRLRRYFSHSLIIHKVKTKEITTVMVVWIPSLN